MVLTPRWRRGKRSSPQPRRSTGRNSELWKLVKQDNTLVESEARMLKQAVEILQKALDQHLYGLLC